VVFYGVDKVVRALKESGTEAFNAGINKELKAQINI
jgi:hypothetical protein